MSVEQYSAEFQKLSRDAPHLIPDEETKAERFRDGLSPQILERIIFLGGYNAPTTHKSFSVAHCNTCGNPHSGVCHRGTRACFKCGREGHFAKECSQVATKSQGT
jgi:hypothetical protein